MRRSAPWLALFCFGLLCGCKSAEHSLVGSHTANGSSAASTGAAAPTLSASSAPDVQPTTAPSATAAFPPVRTDEEIQKLATQRCERGPERPLLLEFGAPWCPDCRKLNELKEHPELARELAHWSILKINVGEIDQNERLLAAFRVSAIATWITLAPQDCSAPLDKWPRLGRRLVEPATGARGDSNAKQLWLWLKGRRAKRK